ncbi:MAG: GspH/FimT family protein [Gammaproteobacteria bacterium]|nr:GspH/FimT family protein [Gammaproteobacteria bacterium]
MSHSRHGFTLLELLLSLGISSVLLGIALPSWKNFTAHVQSKLITERIIESLGYARLEALLTNSSIEIKPLHRNYQNGWEVIKQNNILKIYPASPIKITSLQLSRKNTITFQSNGMSEGSNGSFVVNEEYKITLNRGGRIICSKL